MNIVEPKATHRLPDGIIEGENVRHYQKFLHDVTGLYRDPHGIDPKTLVYEVYSFEEGHEGAPGDLYWGLTILKPLTIGDEYNMTRGHFHYDTACAEFYFGLSGEGLLLLMERGGRAWAERVHPGSLHHIDGSLAHRLINTGDTDLRVGACWPTAAGHDYASIEARDFPYRVMRCKGQTVIEERV